MASMNGTTWAVSHIKKIWGDMRTWFQMRRAAGNRSLIFIR